MAKDFDEIAEKQGWDQFTILLVARDYIRSIGRSDGLAEYAAKIAKEENQH